MKSFSVGLGSDDEGGSGIEDRGAACKSKVGTVNGEGDVALPEALLVHVVEGGEGRGVELGGVETAEGDFTVVLAVGETGDLVGGDGVLDEAVLSQRLDRCEGLLFREGLQGIISTTS